MSDDTRDLVEQGLAISRRKHSSRAEYQINAYDPAPSRDVDISSVRVPHTRGAISGEPSAVVLTRQVWKSLEAKIVTFFNQMLQYEYVPDGFEIGIMVPILKTSVNNKSDSTNDYRGSSINPFISKLFEMCLLSIFNT